MRDEVFFLDLGCMHSIIFWALLMFEWNLNATFWQQNSENNEDRTSLFFFTKWFWASKLLWIYFDGTLMVLQSEREKYWNRTQERTSKLVFYKTSNNCARDFRLSFL